MKTSLVTGGAGFIGSWLCEDLIKKGHRVICLDNLITARKENVNYLKNNGAEFINHDISKPLNLNGEIDYIFHLASPASPKDFPRIPIEIMLANSLGTLNALDIAKNKNSRFLFASTSEVYGNPLEHPQKEDYWGNVNPIGPRSCYDEGKRCAETLFFDYHRQYKVPIKVARIFNTYGPRMLPQDGRVVSNFIVQALNKEPITIYGDGTQTRSFCFVDDLIEGLIALMNSAPSFTGPVNLGNPTEFTIGDLARLIIEMTDSQSPLIFKPLPQDDPQKRKPDIALAKNVLSWEPKIPLREGLQKTIEYFKKLR